MLSYTLRLNFRYLKIVHILHPRYHPKIIGYIVRNDQKKKYVRIFEICDLIIIKMKMKMKKRLYRYDINRPRSRHGHSYNKYKRSLSMIVLTCTKQHLSNIEAQFLQTLSKR